MESVLQRLQQRETGHDIFENLSAVRAQQQPAMADASNQYDTLVLSEDETSPRNVTELTVDGMASTVDQNEADASIFGQ